MRIAMITAVWQRHALTAVFWTWAQHLHAWFAPHDVTLIAAGSNDPEHEALAQDAGAEYIDVPNTPLGRKWNATLKLARAAEADAVLIMGSDDVFCARTAMQLKAFLDRGQTYLGLQDFYFYEVRDGRSGYFPGYRDRPEFDRFRAHEPTGSGRMIPADYLRRLGWNLWKEKPQLDKRFPNHGVDHGSFKRLRLIDDRPTLLNLRASKATAVGLKSGENLWAFWQTHPIPSPEPADVLLGRLPEDVREGIMALGGVTV